MSRSKHSEAQIIAALRQVDAGRTADDEARECGVSEHTIYAWKAKFGGMEASEAQKLRALEDENGRLSQSGIARLPCPPLLAGGRAQTTPDPRIETVQHGRGLAEPKIALPSLKIAAHVANHFLETDASGSTSEGSDSCLEPEHCFGRDSTLRHCSVRKTEPEELPLPRSCYSTLLPVHLQLDFAFEESCEPPHQALARSLTTDVDVAVVRISHKTMPSSLQLPVKLVEYKIRQQRRKRSALRRAFLRRLHESVLQHTCLKPAPNQSQKPSVSYPLGDLTHQFVVVDSVEELFQIEIDHPTVSRSDMLVGTRNRLMRRASGTKPVARFREGMVPTALQNLHHCLLNQSIQHGWDAEFSHPSVQLRDFHPTHRQRLISPTQQLFPDGYPVLLQVVRKVMPGLPPFPFTRLNACQRFSL